MLCQDIIDVLEEHSPIKCAESWDNVGLLAGRRNKQVKKILLALDPLEYVIDQAIELKADLIITHHPLIFSARKSVTDDDIIGRRLLKLIQNDIAYYAMHTNFDIKGMAQLFADKMKLTQTQVLEVTDTDENGMEEGLGKVGYLSEQMTVKELAEYVKEVFHINTVRVCGDLNLKVNKVATCSGSGKSVIPAAISAGAQVLISGDLDHHAVIDAMEDGLVLIDAGHYGSEKMFVSYMSKFLNEKCKGLVIEEAIEKDPYHYI